jgi:ATP-dependent exoDNAse (exonuclease V) beta subunit
MFEHMTGLELPELSSETTDNGRFYTTPEGKRYPSVTTVLSKGTDQSWKDEWIARVGKEEAERISRKATTRGTAVHELVEQYLRNNPSYTKGHMPSNVMSFKKIQGFLDSHIGSIAGLEVPLYSDKLKVAGRVDCIAEWDSVWSIVDFKTSKKEKAKEDIHGYFLQCAAYAMMMFERTGILCKQAVIVMTVDEGESLVFIEKTRDWLPKFIEIREKVEV